ncbi:N-acyl amino acid synthase FeeM domain-containing protein [Terrihabitans rhizophilus]|jgi:N-acyl-L-homoserine lactone synthetase|uniref:N-acyl amino acid synthase FeeM catalytic core domain-containing protein n=1 Tax=Terrihabitans rhizophilus TaxID=3092662 RepID=A0ABU4RQT3_9HYPH|nr:hypothetical protein [Terrihabitans sp. PJ23]MDX6806966.1 hypothetical protein [Terrihabitans sp. PJ23]
MAGGTGQAKSFSDKLSEFIDLVDYRPVRTVEEREAVFRLRHDAYVREGAIEPNAARRFTDAYDDLPNCWIFGIYIDDELASSIRIHVASPRNAQAPGMSVFPDLLQPELDQGRTIIDPTRFVADERQARLHPELPYATVRLGFVASEYFDADIGLATVRAEHQAFYKRLFGLKPLCLPRHYPSLAKPISLMAIHYPTVRQGIMARYPFLTSTAAERERLFGEPASTGRTVVPLRLPPLESGTGIVPRHAAAHA